MRGRAAVSLKPIGTFFSPLFFRFEKPLRFGPAPLPHNRDSLSLSRSASRQPQEVDAA